jgi:hypothetical protein
MELVVSFITNNFISCIMDRGSDFDFRSPCFVHCKKWEKIMIEIKQVANGFLVTVVDSIDSFENKEYVFTKEYQVIKFLKEHFKSE